MCLCSNENWPGEAQEAQVSLSLALLTHWHGQMFQLELLFLPMLPLRGHR